MDRVRGIGVAVITSWCGCSPFSVRRRRWCTPKRCCSSTTTRPSPEGHIVLEQGVGADHQLGVTAGDRFHRLIARLALQRPVSRQGLMPSGSNQPAKLCAVLLGENLRGRHDGDLVTAGHGAGVRRRRRPRFCRSRRRPAPAAASAPAGRGRRDFVDDALLRRRERKGQCVSINSSSAAAVRSSGAPSACCCRRSFSSDRLCATSSSSASRSWAGWRPSRISSWAHPAAVLCR